MVLVLVSELCGRIFAFGGVRSGGCYRFWWVFLIGGLLFRLLGGESMLLFVGGRVCVFNRYGVGVGWDGGGDGGGMAGGGFVIGTLLSRLLGVEPSALLVWVVGGVWSGVRSGVSSRGVLVDVVLPVFCGWVGFSARWFSSKLWRPGCCYRRGVVSAARRSMLLVSVGGDVWTGSCGRFFPRLLGNQHTRRKKNAPHLVVRRHGTGREAREL